MIAESLMMMIAVVGVIKMNFREQQKLFRISSKAGLDLGVWQAKSANDALMKVHIDAGYNVRLGIDGDLVFQSADDAELCGDIGDWIIVENPENKEIIKNGK